MVTCLRINASGLLTRRAIVTQAFRGEPHAVPGPVQPAPERTRIKLLSAAELPGAVL